jgi:hypothetical protein
MMLWHFDAILPVRHTQSIIYDFMVGKGNTHENNAGATRY